MAKLVFEDFRPIRKGEAGYSATARRYISESTGEILSTRAFQTRAHGGQSFEKRRSKAVAQHTFLGAPAPRTYRSSGKGTSYKDFITMYRDTINAERAVLGLPELSRNDVRTSQDFKDAYKAIAHGGKNRDKSADGPLAKALVKMGRRKKEWTFPVGES